MNFDSLKFEEYKDYKKLYDYLSSKINNKTYLLLDKVQDVKHWERTIRSLLTDYPFRNDIKNMVLFENIVRYTLDNIGNQTSSKGYQNI